MSTLHSLFECEQELFAGLAIDQHWNWSEPCPVVHLDFSGGIFHEASALQRTTGHRVAVLVNEYDKPILDVLDDPGIARANRDFLRGLYAVIKRCDEHVRFCFLTGVSKFSKVSLFSGLNNLEDITLAPRFSSICGYRESDLDAVFAAELKGLDREQIRDWYNGYSWGGDERVYNPFDVLLLLQQRQYRNWWCETGSSTFLVNLLLEKGIRWHRIDGMVGSEELLSKFDVEDIGPEALLFQSGYLTVQERLEIAGSPCYRLVICGNCGRPLRTYYLGRLSSPNYHCPGQSIVEGRATYCLQIGGTQVDQAVAASVLEAVRAGGAEAALRAIEQVESKRDAALAQRRLAVERAAYEATRAERAYRAVDPENRRVARGLEQEWEQRLEDLERERTELALRERERPREVSANEREALLALGEDLPRAWDAPTTTARDRKELLRALLEEVVLDAPRNEPQARVRLLWRGGLSTELTIERPRKRPAAVRTDEDTIELLRRLAVHYPDAVIAGILNRKGHRTAYGLRFTQSRVSSLRTHWKIPCFKPSGPPPDGEVVSIRQAAKALGVATSTIHRMLNDGFLAGDQITPGAPWRIRLTEELRQRFVEDAPEGYVAMQVATARLGVSRQTVLEWIKRGKLDAVTVRRGRRGGLRIKLPADNRPSLFKQAACPEEASCSESSRPKTQSSDSLNHAAKN